MLRFRGTSVVAPLRACWVFAVRGSAVLRFRGTSTRRGADRWIPAGPASCVRYWMSSVKVLVVFLMFCALFDITRFVKLAEPTAGP